MSAFKKHPIYCTFLLIILTLSIFGMTGCSTPDQNTRKLMDRLEFDQNEYGSFELEGTLDMNMNPFATTNVHIKLEKYKDKPVEEVAP